MRILLICLLLVGCRSAPVKPVVWTNPSYKPAEMQVKMKIDGGACLAESFQAYPDPALSPPPSVTVNVPEKGRAHLLRKDENKEYYRRLDQQKRQVGILRANYLESCMHGKGWVY